MTGKQAQNAARWFQEAWNIEDWEFEVVIGEGAPSWAGVVEATTLGTATWNRMRKWAGVWVSPAHCKKDGDNVLATLFHEMAHIVLEELKVKSGADSAHAVVERMAQVSVAAYQGKVKVPS